MNATDTTPPALAAELFTNLPQSDTRPGIYPVGYLKTELPTLPTAGILLEMNKGQLVFVADCGCHVHVNLAAVLVHLAAHADKAMHGPAAGTTQH